MTAALKTPKKMSTQRKIVIIAGPNGAGKTTFAREFLPQEAHCPVFINADLIAAGISPFQPEIVAVKAGRIMLAEIADKLKTGQSFAFETTLSGLSYARQIPRWQANGYTIKLFFLSLPNADVAISRVATRVSQGGHNIPEATIRRRFDAGLRNLENTYKRLVDQWSLYDNSGDEPRLIDWGIK